MESALNEAIDLLLEIDKNDEKRLTQLAEILDKDTVTFLKNTIKFGVHKPSADESPIIAQMRDIDKEELAAKVEKAKAANPNFFRK